MTDEIKAAAERCAEELRNVAAKVVAHFKEGSPRWQGATQVRSVLDPLIIERHMRELSHKLIDKACLYGDAKDLVRSYRERVEKAEKEIAEWKRADERRRSRG